MSDNFLLSADDIAGAAGLVAFVVGYKFINLDFGWQGQTVAGAALSALVAPLVYTVMLEGEKKDDPLKPTVNEATVDQGLDYILDWPWGTFIFGLTVIGFTTVISGAYYILLAPEVGAFVDMIPILNTKNIDLAFLALGSSAALLFAGFAGWVVEVLIWAIQGGHLTGQGSSNPIPCKPSGRSKWSWLDLPKDLFWFFLAVPIGIIKQVEFAIDNNSVLPLFFIPMKVAHDQYSRIGDLVVDIFSPPALIQKIMKEVETVGKKAFNDFDSIAKIGAHFFGASFTPMMHDRVRDKAARMQRSDSPDPACAYGKMTLDEVREQWSLAPAQPIPACAMPTNPYNRDSEDGAATGFPGTSATNPTKGYWALFPQLWEPGNND
jgi:hypothetical protein